MTLRERIQKLCKINNTSLNQVETELGFGKGYLSKLDSSTPNTKKMEQVANHFGVTIDFLMGKTKEIKCDVCGISYNPFDEFDCAIHNMYHQKNLNAKEKFPFFIEDHLMAGLIETEELNKFRNPNSSFEKRICAYAKYLEAKFSSKIGFLECDIDNEDYENFCKSEVSLLEPTAQIPSDLIFEIASKYNVDISMLDINNKLLAKAAQNSRILNIIKYALEMDEQQLSLAEKTMKAFISE